MNLPIIAIFFALKEEAAPLLSYYDTIQEHIPAPIPINLYRKKFTTFEIIISVHKKDQDNKTPLIGKEIATLASSYIMEKYTPQVAINFGTAGGKFQKTQVGQVYIADKYICHHDRHFPERMLYNSGMGYYKTPLQVPLLQKLLNLPAATVSSGNSSYFTEQEKKIMQKTGAFVRDMEVAALAWVCQLYSTPLFTFKGITDYYDQPSPEIQFFKNIKKICTSLGTIAQTLLQLLSDDPNLLHTISKYRI